MLADGRAIGTSPELGRLVVPLGPPRAPGPTDRRVNLAVNNGRGAYPWVRATHSAPTTPTAALVDGGYRYTPSPDARVCCGANNRGVAILGDTLYLGTLDAPYPTNLPWPTLAHLDDGWLMANFDGRSAGGSLLGYGTLSLDSVAQRDAPLSRFDHVPGVVQVSHDILELRSRAMPRFPQQPL